MRYPVLALLLTAAAASGAGGQGPSPQALVRRAVSAMGGEQALRDLSTVSLEFNSASFGLGQEETPLSPARGPIGWGRIVTDWRGNRRAVIQEVRQITGAVVRQRQVLTGEIGMTDVNGALSPMGPGAVAAALQGMRLQPDRMLLRALDDPSSLIRVPARGWRGGKRAGGRVGLRG